MSNFSIAAQAYAERVCNGEFPITYTREQVVKHTADDFIAGAEAFKSHVLSVLKENAEASKTLVPEDAARTAQEQVNETYEDLIAIFQDPTTPPSTDATEDELFEKIADILYELNGTSVGALRVRDFLFEHYTITKKQQ